MDAPKKRPIDPERQQLLLRRNRQLHGVALAALLALVILVFGLINILHPKTDFSETENRKLQNYEKPALSALLDGSYMQRLESAFSDQFFSRDRWVAAKQRFDTLLGKKESNGVYLCSGDYLMEPPADPPQDSRNVEAINAVAARHTDLRLNMAVIPNAACILADKLPKNAPVRDQSADLTALAGSLQGISYLDVTAALSAHTDEQLYYRTDHHWTSL